MVFFRLCLPMCRYSAGNTAVHDCQSGGSPASSCSPQGLIPYTPAQPALSSITAATAVDVEISANNWLKSQLLTKGKPNTICYLLNVESKKYNE